MSHVIGIRHDSADEGIPCENGMKVKWYRGRNNVSFVFTTGSCRTEDFLLYKNFVEVKK